MFLFLRMYGNQMERIIGQTVDAMVVLWMIKSKQYNVEFILE